MSPGRSWGKADCFITSLSLGTLNALIGRRFPGTLFVFGSLGMVSAIGVFAAQLLAGRPRPFRWTAWACFVVSLSAISVMDYKAWIHYAR